MKKVFFLIILIYSTGFARFVDLKPVDTEIISLSFNENYKQAINLSEEQIKLNPNTPKYYYYNINAKVLQYYERIVSLDHDKREEGRERINEELIDYFESVADKFEDAELSLDDKFYYGAILGYLARMKGLDGSWWGAFNAGMSARSVMEEIVEQDPEFYDAYLLLGMTEYYADRLSGFVGFIAGALGFSGDRSKGLEYLHLAYEKGDRVFGQTALTLIEIYRSLEDNETKALRYYEEFLTRYPNNGRILNGYCSELMNTWNYDLVDSLISNDNNNLINDYTKARYYHGIGNNELAVKFATKSLEQETRTWRGVNNYARYLIVYNNWLLNNEAELNKTINLLNDRYINVFNSVKENSEDNRWLHELSVLMATDSSLDKIENYLISKPDFNDTLDYESQYNLLVGHFYLRKDFPVKAEKYFEAVISSDDGRSRYSAYKYLIDLYLRLEASEQKVKKLVELIDDFDNDRLIYRARDLKTKYNI